MNEVLRKKIIMIRLSSPTTFYYLIYRLQCECKDGFRVKPGMTKDMKSEMTKDMKSEMTKDMKSKMTKPVVIPGLTRNPSFSEL